MSLYIHSIPTPPRVMTEREQALLLKVTGEHRSGFRDHIIIAMALSTGLREHEIAALNVDDIVDAKNEIRRRVVLRTFKRSAKRPALQEIILSEGLRAKFKKFLIWKKRHGQSADPDSPLFISRKQNRLSTRQMRTIFRNWQERAGLERPYNFHSLRHCAISNIYNRTKDIRLTQIFARHSSVISTERYAHASLEDLVRAVQGLG